ncbi:response regulator transcription factor [Nitriliruptoraceae bacterium ZYF776]|nr:response regulator transcription factor [Profundirhabdus halotolerans]
MRILVVEDAPKMRALLEDGLGDAGHTVVAVPDGAQALAAAGTSTFDAVVLDVMLPGVDGFEVTRLLRARGDWTPILLLTARDGVADRVSGLDHGADDYLVKPFAFAELLSRLRALSRRGAPARPTALRCGPLELDPASHLVTVAGEHVDLSAREFALLEHLLRHRGQVLPRSTIIEHVWGYAYDGHSNVVDVYVRYLREKIDRRFGLELVRTVRGVGYQLRCSEGDA